jgi:hypothetical protein
MLTGGAQAPEFAYHPLSSLQWEGSTEPDKKRHTSLSFLSIPHLTRWPVTFQQVQFLESGENPVGEIDIDAERIKNLALKLERQSFAYQQMVVFGARSRQIGKGSAADPQVLWSALSATHPLLE